MSHGPPIHGFGPGTTTFGPPGRPTLGGQFAPVAPPVAPDVAQGILGDIIGTIGDVIGGFVPGGDVVTGAIGDIIGSLGGGRADPCSPGFVRSASGLCVLKGGGEIPGSPGIITPAERGPGGAIGKGMVAPSAVAVRTLRCPRFADNRTGILWFSPMTNKVVCLPRGVSGTGFGLVRKNKPRAKAIISAADGKLFRRVGSMQKKIQKVARVAGLKGCNLR